MTTDTATTDGPSKERQVLDLLADPNYLCVWSAGGFTGIVRWLQLLVFGVYTFETTRSPLLVSLIPIMWMLPLALCGPLVGVIADRVNRRKFYLIGLGLATGLNSFMALLAYTGALEFWHIAVSSVLSGLFWTTDFPVRRRMLGDIAADSLSTAMSLDSATSNATRMAGPFLGGLLLQFFSMTGVFLFCGALYGTCFILTALAAIPYRASTSTSSPAFLRDLAAGVAFVANDAYLRRLFLITVIFNLFAFPFTSMVPIIGSAYLNANPIWVGVLSSTEGLGALLGAIMIAIYARPQHFFAIYVGGTISVLVLVGYLSALVHVAGGPIHSFVAVTGTLICIGTSTACFGAMQGTLTYLHAPPELRSRVLGVLTLCIGTGPLGFFNVGWMAEAYGVPVALAVTSCEGLFALLVLWAFTSVPEPSTETQADEEAT